MPDVLILAAAMLATGAIGGLFGVFLLAMSVRMAWRALLPTGALGITPYFGLPSLRLPYRLANSN